jgi:hypothetical protein
MEDGYKLTHYRNSVPSMSDHTHLYETHTCMAQYTTPYREYVTNRSQAGAFIFTHIIHYVFLFLKEV